MKSLLRSLVPKFLLNGWRSFKRGLNLKVRTFRMFERMGLHVIPVHYYSPVPDTRELLRNKPHWNKESDLSDLNFNQQEQLHLNEAFSKFRNECDLLPSFADLQSQGFGPGYGEMEALILHCFVRHFQPATIIEVGSGVSTFFSGNALSMNLKDGKDSRLTCIEPYPYAKLRSISYVHEIVEKKVQDVDISFFQQLGNNDILFLDSSHSVKIGSDVNYLILEVLPSLKKGVLIHIHDIPFPYLYPYPEFWIFDRLTFWQEAVLLKAFLSNNNAFEIIYCSSYLHFKNPALLKSTFPKYDNSKHFPSSIWLRKIS
jgi:Methyltransferase domain